MNGGGSENDICIRWQQHRVRGKGGGAMRGLGDCGGGGGGRMQLQTGTEGATAACNCVREVNIKVRHFDVQKAVAAWVFAGGFACDKSGSQ